MKKENCKTTALNKGVISEYDFDAVKLLLKMKRAFV